MANGFKGNSHQNGLLKGLLMFIDMVCMPIDMLLVDIPLIEEVCIDIIDMVCMPIDMLLVDIPLIVCIEDCIDIVCLANKALVMLKPNTLSPKPIVNSAKLIKTRKTNAYFIL